LLIQLPKEGNFINICNISDRILGRSLEFCKEWIEGHLDFNLEIENERPYILNNFLSM